MLLHSAQATHKYLDVFKLKKAQHFFRFCNFTMLQKKQKIFAQAYRAFGIKHQNSVKNMVVKIDMKILRIQGIILRTNEAAKWQKIKNS